MDTQSENNVVKQKLLEKHKNALFISGIALTGLLGVLVGLFVGSTRSKGEAVASEVKPTTEWLPEDTETVPEQLEDGAAEEMGEGGEPTVVETSASSQNADDLVQKGTVKSGMAVITNLTSLGLNAGEAQLFINALDGIFDFRRARPGHEFEIHFNEVNEPDKFVYQASKMDIYVVTRNGDDYKGRKLNIVPDKKVQVFAGTITSSLFGTLKDLGARASLAGKVADILSTQVNFLKEQRPGDTFRVMVEEESLDGEFMGYGPVLALEYNGVKAGKRKLFRFQEGSRNPTYYDDKLISVPSSVLTIPLYYSRMSSPFGWRIHPVLKRRKLHNGTDFSASTGTPVWATMEGTVIFASYKGANGNLVSIKHADGISSHYAHLQRIERGIKRGTKVRRKQVIGYVGSTGRSTGPHLHWGIKRNGKFIDPLKYKVLPGKKVGGENRGKLKKIIASRTAVMNQTSIAPPKGELDVVPEGDFPMGHDDI